MSKIEGTGETWNPVTGCTKYSAGCANCYAKDIALLHQRKGTEKYRSGFEVTLHESVLSEPRQWGNPQLIFVCSMSDLFHDKVPFQFIDKVMEVIKSTPGHTYQLLTKRAERMAGYFSTRAIPSNTGIGVSVEAENVKSRIDYLRNLNAPIKFLSCEPLIADLGTLDLTNIDGVIVGGENANKARPMKEEGVLSIKKQAELQGVLFFFKQGGTYGSDGVKRTVEANGKELQGEIYQEMPHINKHTLLG